MFSRGGRASLLGVGAANPHRHPAADEVARAEDAHHQGQDRDHGGHSISPSRTYPGRTPFCGRVTALAGKKDYPVFLDERAILFDFISISAGVRGTQILLKPDDYIGITRATLGEIAKPKE